MMRDSSSVEDMPDDRFQAFVSYSHVDVAWAQKLQRKLETYRLPKRLKTSRHWTSKGRSSSRLGKIFRDREDLPAAEDLSEAVKSALSKSDSLIVICSPDAKSSLWVAREIQLFQVLHPDRPVLAALIRGEPEEAFPTDLRKEVEPLAADFRKSGDGWRLGFLKIVAGIAGLPLDALVQRDGQRRLRHVTAVTGGALFALLAMIGMTIFSIQQRDEAQHQRTQAEGLVNYMLTDLRTKLEEVGRLDILTDVNKRAAEYYQRRTNVSESANSVVSDDTRLLANEAADQESLGNYESAQLLLQELVERTKRGAESEPDNLTRKFAFLDSLNKYALFLNNRGRYNLARQGFMDAQAQIADLKKESQQLGMDIEKVAYFLDGNMCANIVMSGTENEGSMATALDHCRAAVNLNEQYVDRYPQDSTGVYDLLFHYAWLGDTLIRNGNVDSGIAMLRKQVALVEEKAAEFPNDFRWQEQKMQIYTGFSRVLGKQGMVAESRSYNLKARLINEALLERDSANDGWQKNLGLLNKE